MLTDEQKQAVRELWDSQPGITVSAIAKFLGLTREYVQAELQAYVRAKV